MRRSWTLENVDASAGKWMERASASIHSIQPLQGGCMQHRSPPPFRKRGIIYSYTAGRGGGRKTLVEGERDRCLNCFFPRNSGTTQPHCSAEASPMIQCVVASRLSPPSSVLPFHSFLSAAEEHPIRISSLFSVSIPFWLNALFFSHSAKKRGGAGKRRYIKSFISSFSFSSFF